MIQTIFPIEYNIVCKTVHSFGRRAIHKNWFQSPGWVPSYIKYAHTFTPCGGKSKLVPQNNNITA